MTEETITDIVNSACLLCNGKLGTNYSLDNIKLAFWTIGNVVDRYNHFTSENGFYSEEKTIEHFESSIAEAFVGETDCDNPNHVDGILIRTDPPKDIDNTEVYEDIILHELMHIYCTTHEIESAGKAGQRFFDLYCEDDQTYIGYSIWREFIAEIMRDILYPHFRQDLCDIKTGLLSLAREVVFGNPDARKALQEYLSAVMISRDAVISESWDDLEKRLIALELPFIRIIHHVDNMMEKGIKIDPDDIAELGMLYQEEATSKLFRGRIMSQTILP